MGNAKFTLCTKPRKWAVMYISLFLIVQHVIEIQNTKYSIYIIYVHVGSSSVNWEGTHLYLWWLQIYIILKFVFIFRCHNFLEFQSIGSVSKLFFKVLLSLGIKIITWKHIMECQFLNIVHKLCPLFVYYTSIRIQLVIYDLLFYICIEKFSLCLLKY